jgi:hypothetical protein
MVGLNGEEVLNHYNKSKIFNLQFYQERAFCAAAIIGPDSSGYGCGHQ